MKHLHLTLGYLKEQRAKLDAAISVLETALGGSSANGNGHQATLRTVETALALHEARPAAPTRGRRPSAKTQAKTQAIVAILREAGPGGLFVKELAAAARARGIDGLGGIWNLVRAGTIKKTGKRYSLAREA